MTLRGKHFVSASFLRRATTMSCPAIPSIAAATRQVSPPKWGTDILPYPLRASPNWAPRRDHLGLSSRFVASSASRRGDSSAQASKTAERLTAIDGVGRKTATILSGNGIANVSALQAWYAERSDQDSEELVETLCRLQNGDGSVLRVREAKKVIAFLRPESTATEDNPDNAASPSAASLSRAGRGLTLCVEGNIGVGKTTFLQKLIGQSVELQEVVEVVPEPVEQWQQVGDGKVNLLEMFYNDQRRYAYTFQHYVFVTRVMQEKHSREQMVQALALNEANKKSLRLLERSVFSDRMVFVRAVHEAKCMSDVELSIYDSWFSPMVSALPTLIPDGFIYLKAEPKTCLDRMSKRARNEEVGVSIEYLENLHSKHEDWLAQGQRGQRPCSTSLLFPGGKPVSGSVEFQPSNMPNIPRILQDKVVHMNQGVHGTYLPGELHNIPALILDYNSNIDIEYDVQARQEYAEVVKAYMEYIKQYKQSMLSPGVLAPMYMNKGSPGHVVGLTSK